MDFKVSSSLRTSRGGWTRFRDGVQPEAGAEQPETHVRDFHLHARRCATRWQ